MVLDEIEFSDETYKRIAHFQGDDSAPVILNLLDQAIEHVVKIWPFVGEFGEWLSSEENAEHRLRPVSAFMI
jgi:hypothetical protein